MGFFGSSTFDTLVDKATSEENTTENWGQIIAICDLVQEQNGSKECLKSIYRRLATNVPPVSVMQGLALIDACVNNCGKPFHLEVASGEFENHLYKLITSRSYPNAVSEKAKELLEKWASEFKNDPQLSLIPDLYTRLKKEGVDFSNLPSKRKSHVNDAALKNPDAVTSAEEQADILKAIELSMKDAKISSGSGRHNNDKKSSNSGSTSLYPSIDKGESSTFNNTSNNRSATATAPASSSSATKTKDFRARALYDFEAAEDNELTFKAGEIILVSDNSDVNWWKGSNHRGEGLFPSNFVSTDLNAQPDSPTKDKKVQFKDNVKVVGHDDDRQSTSGDGRSRNYPKVTEIDESRMDRLLYLLHEADPHSDKADSDELLTLEEQCVNMIPLIDRSMEIIDKEHAELSDINDKLNSAFALYHDLMKESITMEKSVGVSYPGVYGTPNYGSIIPNGQYTMPVGQQQYNDNQYSQYGGVPGPNYYPSTNMPSTQYAVQGPVQLAQPGQQPQQQQQQQQQQQPQQQTVIPQMGVTQQPQMHSQQIQQQQQQPLSPYGSNAYPAQSISAVNNISQGLSDGSTAPAGSVVNLL